MAKKQKRIQYITQMMGNRYYIEDFIEKIKQDKENKDIKILSLFVLEVGILENWIKHFNAIGLKREKYEKYFDNTTLGRTIDDFERCGKFEDAKDYRIQKLLTKKYKSSFIKACRTVKNLRNDLYHNLYSEAKNLKSLLENIKPRIELCKSIYKIECENLLNSNYKSLTNQGLLPSNWTIEMLIHVLIPYYLHNKL